MQSNRKSLSITRPTPNHPIRILNHRSTPIRLLMLMLRRGDIVSTTLLPLEIRHRGIHERIRDIPKRVPEDLLFRLEEFAEP